MKSSFKKLLAGYQAFRQQYAMGDNAIMSRLAYHGQKPHIMVVACCDSRVDPALILQCDPGDLFVVRNVANIIPPYEADEHHHGTSAALEFGICYLQVKHLIILGHSQCGGVEALLNEKNLKQNDFIGAWVSLLDKCKKTDEAPDETSKAALTQSYNNALGFPWIQSRVNAGKLSIHRWFFNIKAGEIIAYCDKTATFKPVDAVDLP